MRKTNTIIEDVLIQISISRDKAKIEENTYRIIKNNNQLIIIDKEEREYKIDDLIFIADNIVRVEIDGYTIDVEIQNPLDKAIFGEEESQLGIISPLAGIISHINVNDGDIVEKGQVLMIISAMKMENKIVSKSFGKVKCINVNVNDQVDQGSILIELENT